MRIRDWSSDVCSSDLSYREFDTAAGPFVMPTTTPVQFDPDAWRQTLDRYLSFAPPRMFLTHYSQVQNAPELAPTLRQGIARHERISATLAAVPCRYAQPTPCTPREVMVTWRGSASRGDAG